MSETGSAAGAAWERRSEKVSEIIAREIVRDIAKRGLAPNSTLESESAMLERYQVARGSLREALRILEVHGLIRMKPGPGGGPVVSEVDSRDFGRMATLFFQVLGIRFAELVEARLILEPLVARLAAERRDPEDNDDLRAIVQQGFDAEGTAEWLRATDAFHAKVLAMSGNGLLTLVARAMKDVFTERASSVYVAHEGDHVRRAHADIADAIIAGDAEAAERLMREHMDEYVKRVAEREPYLMDEVVDWR
ncbi:DNA-binding FadR family transcriptional regulator [Spinactinospora alkalitolerans]|uniref:DNA-binding FadR family transcriptional regulator n=1 Tax=Spinactinospora alkalitolerans TaxID=687207 RepID=A0A852U0J9_9ACTN|nr:FCD domain-containing protein [Spinactinospora alkalitolerans]NYE47724.1 DNA-binding FadR family transcriptional regulator [Spinactinospora alkalitolerans]